MTQTNLFEDKYINYNNYSKIQRQLKELENAIKNDHDLIYEKLDIAINYMDRDTKDKDNKMDLWEPLGETIIDGIINTKNPEHLVNTLGSQDNLVLVRRMRLVLVNMNFSFKDKWANKILNELDSGSESSKLILKLLCLSAISANVYNKTMDLIEDMWKNINIENMNLPHLCIILFSTFCFVCGASLYMQRAQDFLRRFPKEILDKTQGNSYMYDWAQGIKLECQ